MLYIIFLLDLLLLLTLIFLHNHLLWILLHLLLSTNLLSSMNFFNGMRISSVLDNKIPHSILFLVIIFIFGSTCFIHNFNLDLDKLSFLSDKCVFLGFKKSQKGYKCFSPSLNQYFVFLDVTF